MLYRQGDVLLKPIDGNVKGLKKHKTNIVAFGEATGHNHAVIDGTVFADEQGNLYVRAENGNTAIKHLDASGAQAEHAPLKVADGLYKVHIEQDYQPEGWRRVAD